MNAAKKINPQKNEKTAAKPLEFNRRILIVEDENEIAASYQRILDPKDDNVVPMRRSSRSSGKTSIPRRKIPPFEVTVAQNPEEALSLVKKSVTEGKPFAMGFFDVRLGHSIDGIELVRQIHLIDPEIYAVFVTAYHDRSAQSIQEVLGEDKADRWDYLTKPFTEDEILQKSRNAVSMWNLRLERKLKDEELAESHRRLLQSDRLASVAAVARGIGHEFGNILVQIMGRAELSLDGDEKELRSALETILTASQTASHILSRFKNLAKPSETTIEMKQILLHEPIEEAMLLLEHELSTSGIQIELQAPEQVQVEASHPSLVQVFVNLFINAIHAMENGGRISVTLRKEPDAAEIRVRDTGPGIPEELLAKVMEPFFTTKEEEGTGLGLAISREIIEVDHGGEMRAENDPAGGACFVIRLPLNGGAE